jgi:choline dehydrogenase
MGKRTLDTFDYIVIGAGTAGGVIAKELSDDNQTSVLVLEAGTNMVDELSSPDAFEALTLSTDNRYSFNTLSRLEPKIGRQLRLTGGRAIGGSSEHNAMYAVRGSRHLYDEWADLLEAPQWNYENIRSLFIQNETYTGNTQSTEERGTNGPIFIRQQMIPENGLIHALTEATSDVLDIPIVQDYNTGIGDCTFFKGQFLQRDVNGFVRSSTATGYLNETIVTQGNEFHPDGIGVGERKLFIFAKSTVNRVLFKQKNGVHTAVGVEYVRNGVSQRSFAKKGVIISAGNFSSVILQRSGIGRPEDLARAGIKTLVNSPNVGHNFQTHYFVGMGIEVETSRLLQLLAFDPVALGAFKSDQESSRRLQLLGFPLPLFVPIREVMKNNWHFDREKESNIMSVGISDLNPRSRGTMTVAHSDPEAYPSISFNPLENPDDLNYIVNQYIETFYIIMRARELDPDGIYKVVFPDESIFNLTDEEEKRRLLADHALASYENYEHFGGQCKMGVDIGDGVVDEFLNVFGTKNLKVADLSISPILPDGNTSIPAQMIGLNAVRFIREGN